MPDVLPVDPSNGYEAVADEYMSIRERSAVGAATVVEWARSLPRAAAVLDLGCGHGVPVSAALIADGVIVYGVDASPTMVAAFRVRFPEAVAECSTVEDSAFFGRRFDGVVAWGLMFLLPPDQQARLVAKVAAALTSGGRFLFTSPRQPCEWSDNLTGRRSISLGADAYRRLVESAGMNVAGNMQDEGENYYFSVQKPESAKGVV